jgi:small GTP-binding protein
MVFLLKELPLNATLELITYFFFKSVLFCTRNEIIQTNAPLLPLKIREMAQEEEEVDFVLKVVVCGEESVGKTSLIRRFVEDSFSIHEAATLGVGLHIRTLHAGATGRIFKLHIWDTSGKQQYRAMSSPWFSGANVFIFVYSICSRRSFDQIGTEWLQHARWINGHDKTIGFLVGTQMDCVTYREVDREEAETWAAVRSLQFVETSALAGDQIKPLFQTIVNTMDAVCRQLTQQEMLPLIPHLQLPLSEDPNATLIKDKEKKSKSGCCFC